MAWRDEFSGARWAGPGLLFLAALGLIAGTLLHWSGSVLLMLAGTGVLAATWGFAVRLSMGGWKRVGELDEARREAAARIESAQAELSKLRGVVDGVADPVLATDASGAVVLANRAAESFFEPRPGPLAGRTFQELFTQSELLERHARALAGEAGACEVRVSRGGTVRVHRAMTVPIAGGGVVITLADITELALAVQLKTDFVANASHELRTPLASIRGAAETIEGGAGEDPAMLARLTRMILENAQRLEEMVRDLLDLSRLESPEAPVTREGVPLERIADELRNMFDDICRDRSLTIVFETAVDEIQTDPRLIRLILKNLVDNAAKFAFEGTAVRITADRAGERVRLCVIDQGQGIPIDQQGRIFERFYQVDASRTGQTQRRGTGLGLAIVKHAVKRLGGTVALESVWKQGTTMTVEIPG